MPETKERRLQKITAMHIFFSQHSRPWPPATVAAARTRGTGPGGGADSEPDPEHVAEFFAETRVDFTFDQALPAAKVWQPDLIVYEYGDFVGPLIGVVLQCPATKLAYGERSRLVYPKFQQNRERPARFAKQTFVWLTR